MEDLIFVAVFSFCPADVWAVFFGQDFSVVLPVSFFEKRGNVYFNSVAVIDADGSLMGLYRKTHIPDGPG